MWLTFNISSIPTPILGNIYDRSSEIRWVHFFFLLLFCNLNFLDLFHKIVLPLVFQVNSFWLSDNSSFQIMNFTHSFISRISLFYTETRLVIQPIFSKSMWSNIAPKMINKFISPFESCYYLSFLHVKHKLIALTVKVLLAVAHSTNSGLK